MNTQKRILIIITKGEIGGAQEFVINLSSGLAANRLQVCIGCGDDGSYLKNNINDDSITFKKFRYLGRQINPLNNLLFIMELKRFLDKNKFDAVHFNSSNSLLGVIGAKLSHNKPRTIFTVHGLSVLDKNYTRNVIKRIIYQIVFKSLFLLADKIVFVSRNDRQTALNADLVNQKKSSLIYNGINTEKLKFLSKEESREELQKITKSDLNDKYIIGSIGRLSYQKNYEFLIENTVALLKQNHKMLIIIIGAGEKKEICEQLIMKHGLEDKIILAGPIPEAYKLLKAFDLFVLTSRYEGLPYTLIESLMAEIPSLATNVNGNGEVITADWGELFQLGNIEDFTKQVDVLRNKKTDFSQPVIKQLKERFLLPNMIEKYIEIYLA